MDTNRFCVKMEPRFDIHLHRRHILTVTMDQSACCPLVFMFCSFYVETNMANVHELGTAQMLGVQLLM